MILINDNKKLKIMVIILGCLLYIYSVCNFIYVVIFKDIKIWNLVYWFLYYK